ncbi:hypothetical protein Rhow_003706 [Rhodococcus wratislaviensis]|uniref:Uncharacterized protein n=1 Tax=Rhodococcus wratislaviensis TaxID=44752 RepID=A0A402C8Y6_RHOWR|nr:hypothetical protein Rhow_003706 [Rhodococcus wratislaviensis]
MLSAPRLRLWRKRVVTIMTARQGAVVFHFWTHRGARHDRCSRRGVSARGRRPPGSGPFS